VRQLRKDTDNKECDDDSEGICSRVGQVCLLLSAFDRGIGEASIEVVEVFFEERLSEGDSVCLVGAKGDSVAIVARGMENPSQSVSRINILSAQAAH
jgi:hypothetical protein